MHFYDFLKQQIDRNKMSDVAIGQVIDIILKDDTFPKHTSDPAQLAIHLYLKLNVKQTTAYQNLLALYKELAPNHKFPERTAPSHRQDMFLDALNLIVTLQNNDSRYKF